MKHIEKLVNDQVMDIVITMYAKKCLLAREMTRTHHYLIAEITNAISESTPVTYARVWWSDTPGGGRPPEYEGWAYKEEMISKYDEPTTTINFETDYY
jgi:hypothetical protein